MIKRIIKLIINASRFFTGKTILVLLKVIRMKSGKKHVIIYFHNIKGKEIEKFKEYISIIKKKCHIVPLNEPDPPDDSRPCISITFDDCFDAAYKYGMKLLQNEGIPFTVFVPSNYLGKKSNWESNQSEPSSDKIISKDILIELAADENITIGSHSCNHPNFNKIDKNRMWDELTISKKTLEGIIDKEIDFFFFPYGEYNAESIKLAKKAGYKKVFSTHPGVNILNDKKYISGRTGITFSEWRAEFYLKIAGYYTFSLKK